MSGYGTQIFWESKIAIFLFFCNIQLYCGEYISHFHYCCCFQWLRRSNHAYGITELNAIRIKWAKYFMKKHATWSMLYNTGYFGLWTFCKLLGCSRYYVHPEIYWRPLELGQILWMLVVGWNLILVACNSELVVMVCWSCEWIGCNGSF